MSIFKGLLYVKHHAVGTRSEGPMCVLQTHDGEYALLNEERHPWKPDYHLEFFSGGIVEVAGELVDVEQLPEGDIHFSLKPVILPALEHERLKGVVRVEAIDFLWTSLIPTPTAHNDDH